MTAILAGFALTLLLWAPFFWCCCATNHTLTVNLRKCASAVVAGETVTVYLSGSPVASGTTNGSGVVTFSLPPGSYTITTTAPTNYDAGSGSATISTSNVSVTITLVPSAGYSCTGTNCNPVSGPPYQIVSWPASAYATDRFGLITLSRTTGATVSPPVYVATAVTRNAALAQPNPWVRDASCNPPSLLTNTDVPVDLVLTCSGGVAPFNWSLAVICYNPEDNVALGACPSSPCLSAGGAVYPSAGTTPCQGAAHYTGGNFGATGLFTPSTYLPSFSGSVDVYFNLGSTTAPYQIYGASETFTITI